MVPLRLCLIGCIVGVCLAISSNTMAEVRQIDGSVLPSAQGWIYYTNAGGIETSNFSVSGGLLTQNTMGTGFGLGGAIYWIKRIVNSNCAIVFETRARVMQFESEPFGETSAGFGFWCSTDTHLYVFSINPNNILFSSNLITDSIDNTTFHTYRAEIDPVSVTWSMFVDDILVGSGSGAGSSDGGNVAVGDLTGSANAEAEIDWFRFVQGDLVDCTVPVKQTTWGAIKSLYE